MSLWILAFKRLSCRLSPANRNQKPFALSLCLHLHVSSDQVFCDLLFEFYLNSTTGWSRPHFQIQMNPFVEALQTLKHLKRCTRCGSLALFSCIFKWVTCFFSAQWFCICVASVCLMIQVVIQPDTCFDVIRSASLMGRIVLMSSCVTHGSSIWEHKGLFLKDKTTINFCIKQNKNTDFNDVIQLKIQKVSLIWRTGLGDDHWP